MLCVEKKSWCDTSSHEAHLVPIFGSLNLVPLGFGTADEVADSPLCQDPEMLQRTCMNSLFEVKIGFIYNTELA